VQVLRISGSAAGVLIGNCGWKDQLVATNEPLVSPNSLDSTAADTPAQDAPPTTPYWWEDPDLAAAVLEVEEFAAAAGWDASPSMFALVKTTDLLKAQPGLAGALAAAGTFTPIAQEMLPGGDLSEALSTISWPAEVAGCVLVQEIVVLPPAAAEGAAVADSAEQHGQTHRAGSDVEITAAQAAAHPDRAEARLVAGVLRESDGGACMLRVRGKDDALPLHGADLAPNLLNALHATFQD